MPDTSGAMIPGPGHLADESPSEDRSTSGFDDDRSAGPRAHERPVVAAAAVLDGPFGPVRVAVTDRAVLALELRSTDEAFLAAVTRRARREPVRARDADGARRRVLDDLARRLDRFWVGVPEPFESAVDLRGLSPWDRRVLRAVRRVPWGRVTSYGRVATAIGARGAARAVGGAVGRNPIGLVIPCHRVIAGDGSLGGYGGSWVGSGEELLDLKRSLLDIEGTQTPVASVMMPSEP